MPISAVLDHVAVAVTDVDAALDHWFGHGAVPVSGGIQGFRSEQVRTGSGAKVEVIGPDPDRPGFMDRYLEKYGTGLIHHVTVKVSVPIREAVATLEGEGLELVDVNDSLPFWHEAFVRPSLVGGLIAQVAWTPNSDEEWAVQAGRPVPPPHDPARPGVRAVRLTHPDLDRSAATWTSLGATVAGDVDGFTATWPRSPLHIEVVRGDAAGPVGLVVDGLAASDRTDVAPAILEA